MTPDLKRLASRVEATPNVEAQLAKVAGLRERVEETLIAILEVAREVRRAPGKERRQQRHRRAVRRWVIDGATFRRRRLCG